ncbi:MAG: AraC family transcriptional regulator [Flavobacteriales bacterium]|nr:AraC family transcriptional regulator [Flavobacteriales bacterium]
MNFQVFNTDPALRPFIRQYWLITGRQEQPDPIELLPDGGVSLVVNLGDGIHSSRFGMRWCEEGTLIVGAQTRGDTQLLLGESLMFGITFKPGGFTFFHRYDPMDRMADDVQPFDRSQFPNPELILRQPAAYVDRFYLERLKPPRFSLAEVVASVEQRMGRVRMDELMRLHCTTARQLERQFKQQLGITPKEFIDLTRFNHAFEVVQREGGTRSMMDIAWNCGYYDHAHMANAFQKHMGRPPGNFVLSDSSKIALA